MMELSHTHYCANVPIGDALAAEAHTVCGMIVVQLHETAHPPLIMMIVAVQRLVAET